GPWGLLGQALVAPRVGRTGRLGRPRHPGGRCAATGPRPLPGGCLHLTPVTAGASLPAAERHAAAPDHEALARRAADAVDEQRAPGRLDRLLPRCHGGPGPGARPGRCPLLAPVTAGASLPAPERHAAAPEDEALARRAADDVDEQRALDLLDPLVQRGLVVPRQHLDGTLGDDRPGVDAR